MELPISLDALIASVRSVAPDDPIAQLEEAARQRTDLADLTDALLGHFVDQARRSGCSWSQIGDALGVSKQAAQQRHTSRPLPVERMTERTRLALERAVDAAQARGTDLAETEHLLLGMLAVPECIAARILAEHGVTAASFDAPASGPSGATPRLSPLAARVVTGALEQALLLGHNYIGTEHLLLAVLAEPEGTAADVLASAGMTLDATRGLVVQMLSGLAQ